MKIDYYPKEEFHDRRMKGVGGSDVGKIMNVSAFGSPLSVYFEKKGMSEPIVENLPMRIGKLLEPEIINQFLNKNENFIVTEKDDTLNQIIYGEKPEYYYHPDGIILNESGDPVGIIEAKYSTRYGKWGDTLDKIPLEYIYQCQWGMFCSGLKFTYLCAIVGSDYRQYYIERDDDMIERIKAEVDIFWDGVQNSEPPEPSEQKDDAKLLAELYKDSGERMEATPDIIEGVNFLQAKKVELKEIKLEITKTENEIMAAMKEKSFCETESFKITWNEVEKSTTSWVKCFKQAQDFLSADESLEIVKANTKKYPRTRTFKHKDFNNGK